MRNVLNLKIPSLLALFLLFSGLFLTLYLTKTPLPYVSRATQDEKPLNLRVSNITDSQVSISYYTSSKTTGLIQYSTDPNSLSQTALDDRDKENNLNDYNSHHITLKGLAPETEYYFLIISGSSEFKDSENYFRVKTAPSINSNNSQEIRVSGKIFDSENLPASDQLVYLTAPSAQVLSVLTGSDGSYNFVTDKLISDDLSKLYEYNDQTSFEIISQNSSSSTKASFNLSGFEAILPDIIVGQEYNFLVDQEGDSIDLVGEDVSFPILNPDPTEIGNISIDTPVNEERLSDQKPLFEGKALPESEVQILIESENPINTNIISDSNGSWSYRPETDLAPGEHTITITTRDLSGILRTVRRKFIVLAEGSQFTDPSVSPNPTTPTPSPTILPSPSPTILPSTTPTPILVVQEITPVEPSPFPTVVITEVQDERPQVDVGSEYTSYMTLLAIFLFISGGLLMLFSKGKISI